MFVLTAALKNSKRNLKRFGLVIYCSYALILRRDAD